MDAVVFNKQLAYFYHGTNKKNEQQNATSAERSQTFQSEDINQIECFLPFERQKITFIGILLCATIK